MTSKELTEIGVELLEKITAATAQDLTRAADVHKNTSLAIRGVDTDRATRHLRLSEFFRSMAVLAEEAQR